MKMTSNPNGSCPVIEIDDDPVIDLDGSEKTPDDIIFEWDARIRTEFSLADGIQDLDNLMKNYLKSAQEMSINFDDNDNFRGKVSSHIAFLFLYYEDLQCCMSECYLENMENILTLYCNLEMECARRLKKKKKKKVKLVCDKQVSEVCKRIICSLTVYLLERTEYILHVLIKMKMHSTSDSCVRIINTVFDHFLTKVTPINHSDEVFCRSYILFQKWKDIRKVDEWKEMDEVMYKIFNKTSESVKNNDTLRRIFKAEIKSTADVVLKLFSSFQDISSAYFKHVAERKNDEFEDPSPNSDLTLLGDESPKINDVQEDEDDDDDLEFIQAYNEMDKGHRSSNYFDISKRCKQEDEDDEVEFVAYFKEGAKLDTSASQRTKTAIPPQTPPPPEPEPEPAPIPETTVDQVQITPPAPAVEEAPKDTSAVSVLTSTSTLPSFPLETSQGMEVASPIEKIVETAPVQVQACLKDVDTNHLYNDYGFITPPSDVPVEESNPRQLDNVYPIIVHDRGDDDHLNDYVTSPSDITSDSQPVINDSPPIINDSDAVTSNHLISDINASQTVPSINDSETVKISSELTPSLVIGDNLVRGSKTITNGMVHGKPAMVVNDSSIIDSSRTLSVDSMTTAPSIPPIQAQIVYGSHFPDNHLITTTQSGNIISQVSRPRSSRIKRRNQSSSSSTKSRDDVTVSTSGLEIRKDLTRDVAGPNVIVEKCGDPWRDHMDTGQMVSSTVQDEPLSGRNRLPIATLNGNSILKPLYSANAPKEDERRSGGIVFTSTMRDVDFDTFARFEDNLWNSKEHSGDFDAVMSGPIVQPEVPLDSSSRSNSPSPAYETIDDVDRNTFRRSLANRGAPPVPLPTPPVPLPTPPQGILKKSTSKTDKKKRVLFKEQVYQKHPVVLVERDPELDKMLIEAINEAMKLKSEMKMRTVSRMHQSQPGSETIRVDYSRNNLGKNEEKLTMSEVTPRLSFIRPNTGTVVKTRQHLEKKPEKRKFEPDGEVPNDVETRRKRVPSEHRKRSSSSTSLLPRKRRPKITQEPVLVQDPAQVVQKQQVPESPNPNSSSKPDNVYCKYIDKPFRPELPL